MQKQTPLRNIREARTLSQAELSQVLGISQQTLSKYERGILIPPRDVQERIAAILGVSRRELGFPESEEAVAS